MFQGLAHALTGWLEWQDLEVAAMGQPSLKVLFPETSAEPGDPSYMAENFLRYKLWFPMVAKAELRRLDLDSTRHTLCEPIDRE
jgi:hypothetical protein